VESWASQAGTVLVAGDSLSCHARVPTWSAIDHQNVRNGIDHTDISVQQGWPFSRTPWASLSWGGTTTVREAGCWPGSLCAEYQTAVPGPWPAGDEIGSTSIRAKSQPASLYTLAKLALWRTI